MLRSCDVLHYGSEGLCIGYRENYIMKLPKGTELAIRKALKKSYSASEVKRILMRTQAQYNAFIREAPAPDGMNIFRSQYYGGLSVFALEGFPDCDFWYLMADDEEQ